MEKQTEEQEQLYAKAPPPGGPIPINGEPFQINDAVPEEPEIRRVIQGL